jgi:hypothetical protein
MTAWSEFSPADFDKSRAPRHLRNRGAEQPGLFFVATPTVRPGKAARLPEQLPGQLGLFGPGDTERGDNDDND